MNDAWNCRASAEGNERTWIELVTQKLKTKLGLARIESHKICRLSLETRWGHLKALVVLCCVVFSSLCASLFPIKGELRAHTHTQTLMSRPNEKARPAQSETLGERFFFFLFKLLNNNNNNNIEPVECVFLRNFIFSFFFFQREKFRL